MKAEKEYLRCRDVFMQMIDEQHYLTSSTASHEMGKCFAYD